MVFFQCTPILYPIFSACSEQTGANTLIRSEYLKPPIPSHKILGFFLMIVNFPRCCLERPAYLFDLRFGERQFAVKAIALYYHLSAAFDGVKTRLDEGILTERYMMLYKGTLRPNQHDVFHLSPSSNRPHKTAQGRRIARRT